MATTTPDPVAAVSRDASQAAAVDAVTPLSGTAAAALVLLSLWSSTSWLLADALPAAMAPTAARGFHLILIALAALPFCLKRPSWPRLQQLWPIAALSLCLIALPSLLLDAAAGKLPSSTAILVFALIPAGLALASPRGAQSLLVPALAAIAGLLLILPISLPTSAAALEGLTLLTLAALLTGASIVGLHTLLPGTRLAPTLAILTLTSGAALLLIATLTGQTTWTPAAIRTETLLTLSADLPETLLLTWLLTRLTPYRLATRYLLTPLFTILQGLILLHPPLSPWTIAGTTLFAASTYRLLTVVPQERPLTIRP
jgi:drug/metabolite transporter (DMT)-like permease